jgi:hypothetical protein
MFPAMPDYAPEPAEDGVIAWNASFPLLTNRFFLYDAVKVVVWTWLLVTLLMAVMFAIAGPRDFFDTFVQFQRVFVFIILGFFLLFLAIAGLFFGNRYAASYRVSPEGVDCVTVSRRGRAANRVAIVAGALALNPQLAGAGLVAASQEEVACSWDEIRRVKEYPHLRVISLMNGWRVMNRLYCTPQNYAAVSRLVRHYLATRPPS